MEFPDRRAFAQGACISIHWHFTMKLLEQSIDLHGYNTRKENETYF